MVCAVGSVLRATKFSTLLTIAGLDDLCSYLVNDAVYDPFSEGSIFPRDRSASIARLKRAKDWLSLLSCEFEYQSEIHGTEKAVLKTINFVKRHFPKEFTVSVDKALAA